VPAVTRHGSLFSCSQVSHNLAENAAHLPATGHSIASVPAVTRHGSDSVSSVSVSSQAGRAGALGDAAAPLPSTGHSIASVLAVTRHGAGCSQVNQIGRAVAIADAPLPTTGHSNVSVLAVTRQGSRCAGADRLTGSSPSLSLLDSADIERVGEVERNYSFWEKFHLTSPRRVNLLKTERVRVEFNSDQGEGSVKTGPVENSDQREGSVKTGPVENSDQREGSVETVLLQSEGG
jgi:hypothetical protein